jgi:hypothetical protein
MVVGIFSNNRVPLHRSFLMVALDFGALYVIYFIKMDANKSQ